MASARVYPLLLLRAASTTCWLLSARIGSRLRLSGVVFQTSDDLLQAVEDSAVHLDHACLAPGLGGGDDLQQLLPLLTVLWQELGGRYEPRTWQASVGMRTGPSHRQAAVAVGQGRGYAPESLLGPCGLGQRIQSVNQLGDDVGGDGDQVGWVGGVQFVPPAWVPAAFTAAEWGVSSGGLGAGAGLQPACGLPPVNALAELTTHQSRRIDPLGP